MDNEIKFKQKMDKGWHYWGYINGTFISPLTTAEYQGVKSYQYLGKKDKNGTDVYVGDILKIYVFRKNYETNTNINHGGYYLRCKVLDVRGNLEYSRIDIEKLEQPIGREIYDQSVLYDTNLFNIYHCRRLVQDKNGEHVIDEDDNCGNYKRYLDIEVITN